MQRKLENWLKEWRNREDPHPLLIRGARQVGKSFLMQKFAKENFGDYIYINLELESEYKKFFESLKASDIIKKISALKEKNFIPGKTLLIIDEIQECPKAIQALRYLYEDMPKQHVIAAGSLLEFVLRSDKFKMPVGRIQYLFLQPLSFEEFLLANNKNNLYQLLTEIDITKNLNLEFDSVIHDILISELKNYMIVGGMPKAVNEYIRENNYNIAFEEQKIILQTYKGDFGKYSNAAKHKYLDAVFDNIPHLISKKFIYSKIDENFGSREIKEAFELLDKAGITTKVIKTSGEMPITAGADLKHFKAIYLDIGLMRNVFDINLDLIFSGHFHATVMGALAEQLVGQEILAYKDFNEERKLFYWEKEKSGTAEIDYLVSVDGIPVPIEVKAGNTGRLTSLLLFLEKYKLPLGIKISQKEFSLNKVKEYWILNLPLYAVSQLQRLSKQVLSNLLKY